MPPDPLPSRLSQLETDWTLVAKAHGAAVDEMAIAQAKLFERYQRPLYAYLMATLRSREAADEVLEQLFLRLVQGRFRNADPGQGRFRDYLKTALIRLVIDFRKKEWRDQKHRNIDDLQLADDEVSRSEAASFDVTWRDELLARAWEALSRCEAEGGQPYYSVLRYRSEHPDEPSAAMAAALSRQLGRELNDVAVRKILERARKQFADLLLDEVAASLKTDQIDAIEEELADLQLLPYCRSAVRRRREAAGSAGRPPG